MGGCHGGKEGNLCVGFGVKFEFEPAENLLRTTEVPWRHLGGTSRVPPGKYFVFDHGNTLLEKITGA